MPDMVHVLAVITAKPGQREKLLEIFNAIVPTVLAEEGCIEYGAAIDLPDAGPFQTPYGEDTYVVIEKWSSMQALMAHSVAPHMQAFAKTSQELVQDRKIHVLKGVM